MHMARKSKDGSIYHFIYDFESDKVVKPIPKEPFSDVGFYGVRYYETQAGPMAKVGDGISMTNIIIDGQHWNRFLRIIRDGELDISGLEAVLSLMSDGLRDEHRQTFVKAVQKGKIVNI